VREYQKSDRALILSTAGAIAHSARDEACAVLDYALDLASCHVICPDESPDLIQAFLLHYKGGIVWGFTKSPYRQMGLFNQLFEFAALRSGCGVMMQGENEGWHETSKAKKLKFRPYLLWK
jgi:hypothetical protein